VQDEAIRSLLLRGYEQFKVFELHDDHVCAEFLHFKLSAYTWIVHANNVRLGTRGARVTIGEIFYSMGVVIEFRRDTRLWGASRCAYFMKTPSFTLIPCAGVPCHPLHRRIVKLLDSLEEDIRHVFVYCQSPHVVVPTSFFTHGCPLSLMRHLLNIIPKPQSVLPPTSSSENHPLLEQAVSQRGQPPNSKDAWKWYWPLTFGGRTSPKLNHVATETEKQEAEPEVDTPRVSEIDKCALQDAISSTSIPAPIENPTTVPLPSDPMPIMEPRRAFVHLSDPANPLLTRRKELYYFIASLENAFDCHFLT